MKSEPACHVHCSTYCRILTTDNDMASLNQEVIVICSSDVVTYYGGGGKEGGERGGWEYCMTPPKIGQQQALKYM